MRKAAFLKAEFIRILSTNGTQRFFLTLIRSVYVMGQYNGSQRLRIMFLTIPETLMDRAHCAVWPPVSAWYTSIPMMTQGRGDWCFPFIRRPLVPWQARAMIVL